MIIKQQKHSSGIYLLSIAIFSLLSISACSPHSGTGTWETDGNNSLTVSKIIISFEGTADFFSDTIKPIPKPDKKTNDAFRRCFWGAASENEMQLQCVHADNTDIQESYRFTIIEKDQAQLTQNEQLIALFTKQMP